MIILKLEILSCQNTGWVTGFVERTAVHTEARVCLNSPQFHRVPMSTVHRRDTEGTAWTRKSFSNLCPYTTPPYQLSRRKGRNERDQSLYFLCSVPSTDNINVQNHTFILPCAFPIQHPVQDQRFLGASLPTRSCSAVSLIALLFLHPRQGSVTHQWAFIQSQKERERWE